MRFFMSRLADRASDLEGLADRLESVLRYWKKMGRTKSRQAGFLSAATVLELVRKSLMNRPGIFREFSKGREVLWME
jgi:hypothetical protein